MAEDWNESMPYIYDCKHTQRQNNEYHHNNGEKYKKKYYNKVKGK